MSNIDWSKLKTAEQLGDEAAAELQRTFSSIIQSHLDRRAAERGYDSIHTGASYRGDANPAFDAEGQALFAWRSAVWTYAIAELAKVVAGTRPIPTPEQFIDELPRLTWPA